jgi:hypothetical protein
VVFEVGKGKGWTNVIVILGADECEMSIDAGSLLTSGNQFLPRLEHILWLEVVLLNEESTSDLSRLRHSHHLTQVRILECIL